MSEATHISIRPQDLKVPRTVLELIPREHAMRLRVCPIAQTETDRGNRTMTVACVDPSNLFILDQLRSMANCHVQLVQATEKDIMSGIALHYSLPEPSSGKNLSVAPRRQANQPKHVKASETPVSSPTSDNQPASAMLDKILRQAISERASDIHIEPQEQGVFVRFRIDGILTDFLTYDRSLHPSLISRIKILSEIDISQNRLPQDGRFDAHVGKRVFDVRVSTSPTMSGESAVLRLLPKGSLALTLPQLGLNARERNVLDGLVHRPYGMVLLTGPTGSGKTTTLYACLSTIDCISKKVVTIEDPVEYQFPRVCQIQVHPKIGLTFSNGLRSILRQDPDIIMVGEIRDLETLDMAIHSALTGHLVLSTLHCNDAAAAAARMVDMGAEPFLVASAVSGFVAQRLVRTICPECVRPYQVSEELRERLALPEDAETFYRGQGCSHCRQTGYYGRISVFEIMPTTEEIQRAIIRKASSSEVRTIARGLGIPSLWDDGVAKARAGITTLEEIMRALNVDTLVAQEGTKAVPAFA